MKILFVFHNDDFLGGSSFSTATLAEGLKKRGHEIHVAMPSANKGIMKKFLRERGIFVHDVEVPYLTYDLQSATLLDHLKRFLVSAKIKFLRFPQAEWNIQNLARQHNFDVIHICGSVIGSGAKTAKKNGSKLVWHVREFVQEDHGFEFYPWVRQYNRISEADAIICVSDAVKSKIRKKCNNDQVLTIYNGIDTDMFFQEDAFKLHDPIRIMFAGGLRPTKGLITVLEAINQVKEHISVKLDIFGPASDPQKQFFEHFLDQYNLNDIVNYVGQKSNIANEYREHDINLVASRMEAFGRTTAEAMLSGCLVIGSDSGGTPELIEQDRGYLFEAQNSGSLAAAILNAANNERLSEMVNNAQYYALSRFNTDNYLSQIEDLYLELQQVKEDGARQV